MTIRIRERIVGVQKPHIFWSKFWLAYEVKHGRLSRIGPDIHSAWINFRAAQRVGAVR